jgi:hypothetical protein
LARSTYSAELLRFSGRSVDEATATRSLDSRLLDDEVVGQDGYGEAHAYLAPFGSWRAPSRRLRISQTSAESAVMWPPSLRWRGRYPSSERAGSCRRVAVAFQAGVLTLLVQLIATSMDMLQARRLGSSVRAGGSSADRMRSHRNSSSLRRRLTMSGWGEADPICPRPIARDADGYSNGRSDCSEAVRACARSVASLTSRRSTLRGLRPADSQQSGSSGDDRSGERSRDRSTDRLMDRTAVSPGRGQRCESARARRRTGSSSS